VDDDNASAATPARGRRTPEEADALRAHLVRQGYPLAMLTPRENEQFWWSLVGRRRRPQLLALLGMNEPQLAAAIDRVRRQRRAVTGRR
jgi:hypothetical protein